MGLPAAKHLDPVVGVDLHIILIPTPAGPVPTPLPHPYVGVLFDVMDYLPIIGSKVFINGMLRATAGTSGKALPPHVPMGGPFAKPPTSESEMFMGSSTVLVDGSPMSFAGLPVLSCQDIGIPAPLRPTKKSSSKSLMLPTTVVMPIPAGPPVLIGGAPTIIMPGKEMLIGPLAKRLGKVLKKALKKSKRVRKLRAMGRLLRKRANAVLGKLKSQKDNLRNQVSRAICAITGHPVDIATGKMFTDFVDLELPGPLPFKLERVWFSTSTYEGPLGYGWHASFDISLAYSEKERVVGVRLADGRVVLFPTLTVGDSSFEPLDKLTLFRDAQGYALVDAQGLVYRFSASRRRGAAPDMPLASIQDRNGFIVKFVRDDMAQLTSIIDSGGRTWTLRFDGWRLSAIEGPHPTDAQQRIVYARYIYDGRGNLVEVHDALGHAQRYWYDRHLLVKETNKNGLSFFFTYDGRDTDARCIRTWGDDGIYDHKLQYESRRTTVENSLGHKTIYMHDGAMVRRTIDPYGNTTATEYGAGYRVTAEVDELGKSTLSTYDKRGNLLEFLGPDGATVRVEYGPRDLPVRLVDPVQGEWTWTRDAHDRVVERKDPLGRVTRYLYSDAWLVGIIDPAGGHTALGYSPAGNIDLIATPDGRVTRYSHDALDRVIAITDPKGNEQRRTLDLLGRPVRIEEPDGNVRELDYDREGNVVHAKDLHHDVQFTYQGMGRLRSRSEAGTTVRFDYDTEEQLTGIVNEHGYVYRFKLGPTGEVDEEHGFDGLMRKYTRDQGGRVLRVERPAERFSEYEYDLANHVIEVKHSDGSNENCSYRMDGALMAASNAHADVTFERDLLGRITKEESGNDWVKSEYDKLGLRIHVSSSKGLDQVIARNIMGDVTRVDDGAFEARFIRDELGLEIERILPGGVRSKWQRDNVGRPTQHTVNSEAGALRAVGYKWEANDRLRTLIDGQHGTTQYSHDALGNLNGVRYADGTLDLRMPDAVGNLFKREDRGDRQYGPAGQLLVQGTAAGPITYAYDPEGNLVKKREPSGGVWHYEWNGSGMLAEVTRPDGSAVTFHYDALGRRVQKSYRGQTTHWIWDGNTPLHEWVTGKLVPERVSEVPWIWSADPIAKKREAELQALLAQGPPERGTKDVPITWLFEPESFSPMAKVVGKEHFSIITDHLGTPVLMADSAGNSVWSASLSAYGELRQLEGQRHVCPFRWPGQYEDVETGLYYNRFRYYDAESGQYTSQDPFSLLGGFNQRAYVTDPNRFIDPLGLYAGEGTRPLGAYHSFFENMLDATDWQKERDDHFQKSNEALFKECERNPALRNTLQSKYPGVLEHIQPGAKGAFSNQSPPGMTWHHHNDSGRMQLVDRSDHKKFHKVYHPDGSGGHKKWGKGCPK